jgi:hypothetical protein
MEWCLAVSSGDKAFGEFQAIQGGAAYFFAEDQGGSIQSRIGALCKGTGRDVPDAFYLEPCGQSINMMEDQSATALLAAASRIPDLKLLVLDPLRNVHSGKEDSSDEMSQLMGRLSRLATILKCTVLFVHHNAKSSADTSTRRHGQKMRGSSAVHGAITSGFYMVNTAEDPETGAIVNTCHTEVKGAKSAGKFHVALQIVDNEFDVAESAEWQILEEDARATGDQDMAAAIMALGEWGRNASRNGAPLAQDLKGLVSGCRLDEMKKALKACVAQGFMKDVMVSGLQCGYEFTDAGRTAFNEMTSAGVSVDQVKSKGKSHI